MTYDVIVVGGGHAGCEAALVAAKKNKKTLLITSNLNNIATLPCNPSIGGNAKGVLVREIDALGGEMAKIVDKSLLQIKMINISKGPAVQSLRAQVDKVIYPKEMRKVLINQKNLTLKEGMVENLIIINNKIEGIILSTKIKIASKIVILTTGTYLKSEILIGSNRIKKGPNNQATSKYLSDNLKKTGFNIIRLKTGTPPRLERNTIDFNKMKITKGDNKLLFFSLDNLLKRKLIKQDDCYLLYTNQKTHNIILDNLTKSSMYGGHVVGVGPRYCPSIEDKIVRFKDKSRHQLFLEPESRYYDDIYLQGFATSMPHDVQEAMVHSLEGLENANIKLYAYAIEYDAIDPIQLKKSLETKLIANLFTAGQINGTSGYEEAAAQGLIAGINAVLKLEGKNPLILRRDEAYIGVLIDDLVTKGTNEPYRLLTSRAEYRLLLRHDNADLRLREYGYKIGLINEKKYKQLLNKKQKITNLIKDLKKITIKKNKKLSLYDYLKRATITFDDIDQYLKNKYQNDIKEQVLINIKYEGYIKKMIKEAKKMIKNENQKIPNDIDYYKISNLATEARQKLNKIKPSSLGMASRISGVNPSDIAVLTIYLKKREQCG